MLNSNTLLSSRNSILNSNTLLSFHDSMINLATLKESLVLQKKNLSSSKEYLKLKQIFYRTGKKLGKTPSLITEKNLSSESENQIRLNALRIRILDFKQNLVWEGIRLKLSPKYQELKAEFYRLGRNLGLKATLKPLTTEIQYHKPSLKKLKEEKKKNYVRDYLDMKDQIVQLKATLKIQGVLLKSSSEYSRLRLAFYRMSEKVGFRPTLNVKKFPTESDILKKARDLTKSF